MMDLWAVSHLDIEASATSTFTLTRNLSTFRGSVAQLCFTGQIGQLDLSTVPSTIHIPWTTTPNGTRSDYCPIFWKIWPILPPLPSFSACLSLAWYTLVAGAAIEHCSVQWRPPQSFQGYICLHWEHLLLNVIRYQTQPASQHRSDVHQSSCETLDHIWILTPMT